MVDAGDRALADLSQRLQRVEDELAIHKLIVRYGLAVDAGEADAAMRLFTEDTVYDVGSVGTGLREGETDNLIMKGQKAVRDMVKSERHQALLPFAAHTIGPAVVEVDGDHASATGYTRIYHREDETFRLFRIAINTWQLAKENGSWRIRNRVSRVLGDPEVQDLMRQGLVPRRAK